MDRTLVSSGTPWETRIGYSRVVRVGPFIQVAGTIASDETGTIHAPGDAYEQARYILDKIARSLDEAGAEIDHVVRVRVYLVNVDDLEGVGRAHYEAFADVRPANTTVVVAGLASPEALVEIEVEAICPDS